MTIDSFAHSHNRLRIRITWPSRNSQSERSMKSNSQGCQIEFSVATPRYCHTSRCSRHTHLVSTIFKFVFLVFLQKFWFSGPVFGLKLKSRKYSCDILQKRAKILCLYAKKISLLKAASHLFFVFNTNQRFEIIVIFLILYYWLSNTQVYLSIIILI